MKWTYGSTEIILQDKVPESVLIQYLYRSYIYQGCHNGRFWMKRFWTHLLADAALPADVVKTASVRMQQSVRADAGVRPRGHPCPRGRISLPSPAPPPLGYPCGREKKLKK
jgi:hypothetical protein